MNSEEIKKQLDEWITEIYEDNDEEDLLPDILGQWKHISTSKNSQDQEVHIFENIFLHKQVMTIGKKIQGFLAQGDYVFYISYQLDEKNNKELHVVISDYEYYKKYQCASDWHLKHLVALPHFLHEIMEATFISEKDEQITRTNLIQMGFIEDPKFSQFIQNSSY